MPHDIVLLTDPIEKSKTCAGIIHRLPSWFGLENANNKYIQEASALPALVLKNGNENAALLVYKQIHEPLLDQTVTEIHWLGVLPEFHRNGFGRQLVIALTDIARSEKRVYLTVETLDPEIKDKDYLKTFWFYESLGFSVFHRFCYDEKNPMVKMRMPV